MVWMRAGAQRCSATEGLLMLQLWVEGAVSTLHCWEAYQNGQVSIGNLCRLLFRAVEMTKESQKEHRDPEEMTSVKAQGEGLCL